MISELTLIRRIRELAGAVDESLIRGIGDDCAVLAAAGLQTETLVTTDTLVEGVHFDLAWHPPELLGQKALSVNVSDIAAMGGVPRFALLSLAVPATAGQELINPLMAGFIAALERYGVRLIGGDTVKSDQGLVLSVTVLGEARAGTVVYRSGARPGDQIWVSGYLGQAAAGLELCRRSHELMATYSDLVAAHVNPQPEMTLGRMLGASGLVTAMIDMSDGLASDLAHICEESGVGAEVRAQDLPVSESTRQAAQALALDPMRLALSGGEDYRLLFTAPASAASQIDGLAGHAIGGQLFSVGEIVSGAEVVLINETQRRAIGFQGYDHFRGNLDLPQHCLQTLGTAKTSGSA
ncbi:MAG: thiamine-phosphate kinase [Proteobacteria bacterium]|nr:thiamine-phosphate kinase [Desulfobulbaceae bacterium]MBU4153942.1 thiamine-phosphate kinase [Pseudomonadota bacterium]